MSKENWMPWWSVLGPFHTTELLKCRRCLRVFDSRADREHRKCPDCGFKGFRMEAA